MEVLNLFPVEFFVFKNNEIDNTKLIAELEALDGIEIKQSTTMSLLVDLRKNEKFKKKTLLKRTNAGKSLAKFKHLLKKRNWLKALSLLK